MGKKHGEAERGYRTEADKYDSEWLDPQVFGHSPSEWDSVQSAPVPVEAVTRGTFGWRNKK